VLLERINEYLKQKTSNLLKGVIKLKAKIHDKNSHIHVLVHKFMNFLKLKLDGMSITNETKCQLMWYT